MIHDDNYRPIVRGILKKLLAQTPTGADSEDLVGLHHSIEAGGCNEQRLQLRVLRAGTDCTLSVLFEEQERETDETGALWRVYKVATYVNWPTHGSQGPTVSLARLGLYREVTMLAAEIEAELPAEIRQLWRTADQMEEIREAEKELKLHQVRGIVRDHGDHLKIGEAVVVQFPPGVRLNDGVYEVEVQVFNFLRHYSVRVSKDAGIAINRSV